MDTTTSAHPMVTTSGTGSDAPDRWPQLPQGVALSLRDHLVAESWITAAQFQDCLRTAESRQLTVTDALVELLQVPESTAYGALSLAAGIPLIDLEATSISRLALQLIPERIARRWGAIPVAEDNRTLTFATSQPFSTETEQDMSFASGRYAKPILARPSQIAAALNQHYRSAQAGEAAVGRDADGAEPPLSATTNRKRVLVADDDRMIRLLVRTLLEKEGYEVYEAENGRETAESVLAHAPDLLIADLIMPDGDGFETVGSLRSESNGRDLPVVVLTAESVAIAQRTVLFLGADDYVTKPFDADMLLGRVRSVFVRRLQNKY